MTQNNVIDFSVFNGKLKAKEEAKSKRYNQLWEGPQFNFTLQPESVTMDNSYWATIEIKPKKD